MSFISKFVYPKTVADKVFKENTELLTKVGALTTDVHYQKHQLCVAEGHIRQLEKALVEKHEELQLTNKVVARFQTAVKDLQEENGKLIGSRIYDAGVIGRLNDKLKDDNQRLRENLTADAAVRFDLEVKVTNLKGSNVELRGQVVTLQNQRDHLRQENVRLREAEKRHSNAVGNAKYVVCERVLREFNGRTISVFRPVTYIDIEGIQKVNTELTNEVQKLQGKLRVSERFRETYLGESSVLRNKLADMTAKAQDASTRNVKVLGDLRAAHKEIDRLLSNCRAADEVVRKLQATNRELRKRGDGAPTPVPVAQPVIDMPYLDYLQKVAVAYAAMKGQTVVPKVEPAKKLWILRHEDGRSEVTNNLPAEPGTVVSARLFKGL